jgi:hypothetical protein
MSNVLISLSRAAGPRDDHNITEARDSFEFWSRRADQIPWHKRAARREAREKAASWRARLIAAHLGRSRLDRWATPLTPLLDTRGRGVGAHARSVALSSMRRNRVGRRLLMIASAAAAFGAVFVVASLALVAHLAGAF